MTSGKQDDSVSQWDEQVSNTVSANGFMHAWNTHFSEIVEQHHSLEAPETLVGARLYQWMLRDAELRRHFENLSEPNASLLKQSLSAQGEQPAVKWKSQLHRDFIEAVQDLFHLHAKSHPEVTEGNGSPMYCLRNEPFYNWGRTVENIPEFTFVPKTKVGICNLVKWAAANEKKVRAAGYRHTWGDLYSANGQVLISMLPFDIVDDLPATEPAIDPNDQLQGIEVVGTITEDGTRKALCKIGAATTNEQFRRWCLDERGGNWQWTVPLNVIMVEITWGGSNAPICHGAGWKHQTLSDLVTEIEFVNVLGDMQVVSDAEELKAASGCFGLLGIVTSLTLKLDPMSYAVLRPVKPRVALTIPPPKGFPVPSGVDMTGISEQAMDQAWEAFVQRCETDYYSEWFWFVYQKECWVNTWKNDGKREDAQQYPTEIDTVIQETEEYLGQLLNSTVYKLLPGRWQADLLAFGAMSALPENTTTVAPLIDALHFRRGIQNMRVLDMELQIPIPPRTDDPDKPDWTVAQKAWWAVLANIYDRDDAPLRIAMEMRIMGHSNVTMAPQFGNRFGTCSIEVLTNLNVSREDWQTFMQQIADTWVSLTGPDGAPLNVRPHWAKQWQGLKIRGRNVNQYLKNVAYQERIPEFKQQLEKISQNGGYTLQDLSQRFSNPLLDSLFGDILSG